ncbi:DUF4339 domain-containing protein [Psychroflexus sp. ALD_RP9]|uniref:DUF4339 domain-containing protein n=1 Tax=Psychroflexus sp. ALD_RP9 TaxID=2777186 RepID=UPI001A8EC417|nr:DUF4339 domain-containing protein [Psychroflexus sp. ALD_RP9]QSS96703.1 DUF4339 domain-containing protein [Psychroflexus sp. ALD_RP9]
MKEYFIILNDKKKGPLSKKEINEMELNNKTPIWCEGMSDWKAYEDLKEFKTEPPNYENKIVNNKSEVKSLSKAIIATEFVKIFGLLKYSLIIALIAFLFFSIYNKGFSYMFEIDKIYWSDAREALGYIPSEFKYTRHGNGYGSYSVSDKDYGDVKKEVVIELFSEAFEEAIIVLPIAFGVILFIHYLIYLIKWTRKHANK